MKIETKIIIPDDFFETVVDRLKESGVCIFLPCEIGDTVYWISDDLVREKHGEDRFKIENYTIKAIRAEITESGTKWFVSDGCSWNELGGEYAIPDFDRAVDELERLKIKEQMKRRCKFVQEKFFGKNNKRRKG